MARRPSEFIQWAGKFYRDYLTEKEDSGGWSDDFVTAALRVITEHREETGIDQAVLEMAAKTLRGLWHDDPENKQLSLFSVAGIELEGTYTWADATVPGFHRRVLARWATPRIVERDALLAQEKAQEAVASSRLKLEAAARIMAAVPNPDALLWDHRDGMGPPHYGASPSRPRH